MLLIVSDFADIYQRSNDTRTNNEELHLNVTSDEYPSIYNNTQQSQLEIEKSANEPSIGNSSEKTGRDKMTVSRPPPCPVGFIRYKNSCYHIVGSSELTWSIANTYCQLHGSKLVEIESESEQRFIANMIKVKKGMFLTQRLRGETARPIEVSCLESIFPCYIKLMVSKYWVTKSSVTYYKLRTIDKIKNYRN